MDRALGRAYQKLRFSAVARRLSVKLFSLDRSRIVWDTRHNYLGFPGRIEFLGEIWPPTLFEDKRLSCKLPTWLGGYRKISAHGAKEAFLFAHAEVSSITGLVSLDRRKYFTDVIIGRNSPEALSQLPLRRVKYSGRVYVANERNFYHFVTEDLVNIVGLRELGADFRVVVPGLNQWKSQLLSRFCPEVGVLAAPSLSMISVSELLAVTKENHDSYIHPGSISMLSEMFQSRESNRRNTRRVYISRRGAPSRRPVNEDAVEEQLSKRGFQCVMAETLAVADQVDLFSEAAVVVAPHGAGLTNVLAMKPRSLILEIFDPAHINFCYVSMAAKLGLNYWPLRQQPLPNGTGIDLEALLSSLNRHGINLAV